MANQQSPPWLAAMLAQMYPGGSMDTAYTNSPWNKAMPGALPQGAGGRMPEMQTPIQGVDQRLLPAGPGTVNPIAVHAPRGNPSATPAPDANRVGGAPSPGIPAPQNFNRTANNPPFAVPIQYGVPGSGRGGANPIYTALNLGGQPNAPQVPPAPKGALSASTPQSSSPGPAFDVGGMFANLPPDVFGGSGGRGGANWWDQVDPQALAALHSGFA